MVPERTDGPAARWFARFTVGAHAALPQSVRRVLPATFIGFALINGSTFLLDMGILTIAGHYLPYLPYGLVYTIGFAIASVVAFVLNRWLNFREHGDLGKQGAKYVFVIVSNYLIWILGFGTLLGIVSVPLLVGRVIVAVCEGLYIYTMLRLWVFPRGRGSAQARSVGPVAQPAGVPSPQGE